MPREKREHVNGVSEVWPGVWSGSAMMANPTAWMYSAKIDHCFILSRSTYQAFGWATVKNVTPLFIDDAAEGLLVGQAVRLVRILSLYNKTDRVGFLCQAGLNRSSLTACLWRWWWTGRPLAELVRQIRDVRTKAGAPDVFCNDAFVEDLLSIDGPLSRQSEQR